MIYGTKFQCEAEMLVVLGISVKENMKNWVKMVDRMTVEVLL